MGKDSVRCFGCKLVQFTNDSGLCRRCRKPYRHVLEERAAQVAPPAITPQSFEYLTSTISKRIKELRVKRGFSQRAMAEVMKRPRTYISKIENSRALPNLASMERFAKTLKIPMGHLLLTSREVEESNLMNDPFLAEMAALGVSLRPEQRDAVVIRAMKLSTKQVEG